MHTDPTASVEPTEFFIHDVPGQGEMLVPPPPPNGYEPISAVQAVSSADLSGYWACLAYEQQHGRYGLLIYWRHTTIYTFYPTEDALHLLCLYGAVWGFDVPGSCVAEVQSEPGRNQLDSNEPWWNKQSMFVDQQQSNEEVHDAME